MGQFVTVWEAVLDAGAGELARVELTPDAQGNVNVAAILASDARRWLLAEGDTIRIERRETER